MILENSPLCTTHGSAKEMHAHLNGVERLDKPRIGKLTVDQQKSMWSSCKGDQVKNPKFRLRHNKPLGQFAARVNLTMKKKE